MFTLTSPAALKTQRVPVLVLPNNSIYCCVRGAPWSHQDLEPSWKSVTVPVKERLNPVLPSVCAAPANLSGDNTTPSRAANCTVTGTAPPLPSVPQGCTPQSIIAHSQPAQFHAELGAASCQVLSTSQLEKVVDFNNQPGKFSSRRA